MQFPRERSGDCAGSVPVRGQKSYGRIHAKPRPPEILAFLQEDECFGCRAVSFPVIFVAGPDAFQIDGKRRIPVVEAVGICDTWDFRSQCRVQSAPFEREHTREAKTGRPFDKAPLFEPDVVTDLEWISRSQSQVALRPLIEPDGIPGIVLRSVRQVSRYKTEMRCAAAKEVRGGDYGVGNGLCARADRVGKIGVDSVRLQTRGGCGFHDCARKGFFQQDSRAFHGDSVPVFKDAQPQPQVLGSETVSQQLSQYFRMIAISLSRYQERVDAAGLFEIDLESLERDKDRENARLPRLERKLRQRVRRQDLAANQADGPPDIVAMTVERFRRDARRVFDSQENRILKLNLDLPC